MSSKRTPDIDPATAARRHALALRWRDEWRRETVGADPAAAQQKSRPKPEGSDFASAIARSEFGRHYVDPQSCRQVVEKGAVVMRRRDRRRRPD